MIKANNLWEADAIRRHKTVTEVEFRLGKMKYMQERSNPAAKRGFQTKINFLTRLREQLAAGRGL